MLVERFRNFVTDVAEHIMEVRIRIEPPRSEIEKLGYKLDDGWENGQRLTLS